MSDRRAALLAKVAARVVVDADGCHIWQGPDSGKTYKPGGSKKGRGHGYPRMNVDGGTMAVHIVVWVCNHGPIPPRKQLDHRCRKRRCVKDACLELVTHRKNQLRRAAARKNFSCEEAVPELILRA